MATVCSGPDQTDWCNDVCCGDFFGRREAIILLDDEFPTPAYPPVCSISQGKMFAYSGHEGTAASDDISFVFVEQPEIPVLKGRGLLCCARQRRVRSGFPCVCTIPVSRLSYSKSHDYHIQRCNLFRAFSPVVSCSSFLVPFGRPADCRLHHFLHQQNILDEGFFLDDTPRANWHP